MCEYNPDQLATESLRHYSGAVAVLKLRKTVCGAADTRRELDKLVRSWVVSNNLPRYIGLQLT